MSLSRFHTAAISVWLVLLLVVSGIAVALGAPVTLASALFLLVVAALPPAIIMAVFRGAPEASIGQVLYNAENASREVRIRLNQLDRSNDGDVPRS